jgi:hypothetical protein
VADYGEEIILPTKNGAQCKYSDAYDLAVTEKIILCTKRA